MKKYRIIIAVSMAAVLLLTSVISVSAQPAPQLLGDVNLDRDIDVKDATLIQKYLAGIEDLNTRLQVLLADCNGNERVEISDATLIQKTTAGIVEYRDWADSIFSYSLYGNSYISVDSGKAMVGMPVTFTVEGVVEPGPATYEFYIEGKLVQSRSDDNSFTCTFDEAGYYHVTAKCYNAHDLDYDFQLPYQAVDAYTSETPVIYSNLFTWSGDFNFDVGKAGLTLTSKSMFGEEPYEYSFKHYVFDAFDNALLVKTQDFSASNEFLLCDDFYPLIEEGLFLEYIEVTVRDANGNETTESVYVDSGIR